MARRNNAGRAIILDGDIRMTVKEVAKALGVDESTVRHHIEDIRIYSGKVAGVEQGKTTYMDEAEVTEIRYRIARSG